MDLEHLYDCPPATFDAILRSRELRVERQANMLKKGYPCIVSFTLNIPGAKKQFSLARFAFDECAAQLKQLFCGKIMEESYVHAETGSEGLLALNGDAQAVKSKTIALEEQHPLGRLFDIDVYDAERCAISRSSLGFSQRQCLLCERSAKICARAQTHTHNELQLETARILTEYYRDRMASRFATQAVRALLYEVAVTPKPGLVDRLNSGSHTDMDFFTFLDSSSALSPWFREMFLAGWNNAGLSADELFLQLRFLGRCAEQDMFSATCGVNTHKGSIFSLGLFCGACGAVQSQSSHTIPLSAVISFCRKMGEASMQDFHHTEDVPSSNGISCFNKFHATGVRGEAAAGFPSAINIGLPALRKWITQGLSVNDAAAITLLEILAQTSDTNMLHRGGYESSVQCRTQAHDLLKQINRNNYRTLLERLDKDYIAQNLSPGGCADLLALSLMILFLEDTSLVIHK